jgi:hypothetical protein
MQDKLAEAVKDDPGTANISRKLGAVGVCALPLLLLGGNLIVASKVTQLMQYKITVSTSFLSLQQLSLLCTI